MLLACVALSGCKPTQTPSERDILADLLVVDGNLNLRTRVDPECRHKCERRVYRGDIKALSGVDIAASTFSSEASLDATATSPVPGALVIKTQADLDRAASTAVFGQLLALQRRQAPAWQLSGDVSTLNAWHARGVRMVLLAYSESETHGVDERLGHASDEPDDLGLTALGRAAIARMNELGMVIDVSHCNEATTIEAAQLSERPIVSSHANAAALVAVRRNKSDAEIIAIAESGGVVAVTPIQWMTTAEDRRGTVADLADHIDHVVGLVGIDHVGIAADSWVDGWDDEDMRHRPGPELDGVDRWRHLVRELKRRGYGDEQIAQVMGRNLQRVFRTNLPP